MKSQPLAYNKDNQEDKEPLFDIVKTVKDCLTAFADMIPAIETKPNNMRAATMKGFATATDPLARCSLHLTLSKMMYLTY